jgi:transcriptional regulator with XRE-family HTH domain
LGSKETADIGEDLAGLGARLRHLREASGLSQRELGRRVGLSGSMISQLENGLSRPSVATLYGVVTELGASLDHVIRGDLDPRTDPTTDLVIRAGSRPSVSLESGVRWEELAPAPPRGVDFIHARYDVGGSSTPDGKLMRHTGREHGYVVSGVLGIQIAEHEYTLNPGDSIVFDSALPHRLYNKGDVPVESVWVILGSGSRSDELFTE